MSPVLPILMIFLLLNAINVVIYCFLVTPFSVTIQNLQRAIRETLNANGIEEVDYKIDGMYRFEWYSKMRKEGLKGRKPSAIDGDILMLSAYEYDAEYSISIINFYRMGAIVYCRYFDESGSEILPAFQSYNYPDYVVNCRKRSGTKRLSLSALPTSNYAYPISPIDRTKKEYKHELSLCMAPIYGNEPKWLMLAELVEHYKLQGVTHFYFYVFHIDEYSNNLLIDYVRTGEATIINFMQKTDRDVVEWQMIAIRDCTLRTRYESKWSIFADLDERLLMTKYPGRLIDYVRGVTDPKIATIVFRQQWVLKTELMPDKYQGDRQIDEWSPTLRWHNSTSIAPSGYAAKCVIRSEGVFSMWVHYPYIHYPGYKLHRLTQDEGVVRHFRDVRMGEWGAKWLHQILVFGPMSMTDYPAKYQRNLTDAVKRRLKYLYGKL